MSGHSKWHNIRLKKGTSEEGPTRVADQLSVYLRLKAIRDLEIPSAQAALLCPHFDPGYPLIHSPHSHG